MWDFKEKAGDKNIVGYMTAPWCHTRMENKEKFDETFRLFKAAKEEIYGE